jgi:serine/threonine-protein kinase
MDMGPDRWATVDRLYHAALTQPVERRAAFLAEACAGDDDVRHEVESLLAQAPSADGVFARGAAFAAAGVVSDVGGSLTGRRLGAYQILAPLGAGGMGEVYRARDTRLGRDVAIKILPRAFTSDADRLARFEREARVLASINHRHIAAIYGIEDAPTDDGASIRTLVLELVDGETLADRIARSGSKGLPIKEALDIARQIADALDAAHEKGIVHRDLKPANIKITPQGVVKVLDFGLAKLDASSSDSAVGVTTAPTLTVNDTREGLIIGTAAYMSPEQARGHAVDRRTDIWAFGCVVYEMLTGRATFARSTIADTLAAVVEREPEWDALPPDTPGNLRDLLHRALQKDVRRRLRDAGDALNELVEPASTHRSDIANRTQPAGYPPVRRFALVAVSALVLGAVITATSLWIAKPWIPSSPTDLVQFVLGSSNAPPLEPSGLDRDIAISPDGSRVVYIAGRPGRIQLVTRPLMSLDTALLSESGTPRAPFFSPDGQWVGFFELFGNLRKISISGGPVTDLSRSVGGAARGASWARDNFVYFATSDSASGLWRVAATGGEPESLTRPDPANGELDHFWPEALPDGRGVLFTTVFPGSIDSAQVTVFDTTTRTSKVLVRGGTGAIYIPTGHLLYGANGALYAVPFDAERLEVTGTAVKVLEPVAITPEGALNVSVSAAGTLAYVRADSKQDDRTLVWVSREGREDPIAAPARPYVYPRLSPDGTRIAVEIWDRNRDIWVWDLARETLIRVTENPGRDGFPVWTPDGRRLVFGSAEGGATNLFWRPADGTGAVNRFTKSQRIQFPYSISPDGTQLIIREDDPQTGLDISVVSLKGSSDASSLIRTPFNEQNAEVSPDGRWLAYQSNESGQDEIYVRPFPNIGGGRWQVSTAGGTRPVWSSNGRELFYLAPNGLSSAAVTTNDSFAAGRPIRLIEARYFAETAFIGRTYDVSRDSQRFLMIKRSASVVQPEIVVVQNWDQELKRLAPAR